jgi:hypothetical protein
VVDRIIYGAPWRAGDHSGASPRGDALASPPAFRKTSRVVDRIINRPAGRKVADLSAFGRRGTNRLLSGQAAGRASLQVPERPALCRKDEAAAIRAAAGLPKAAKALSGLPQAEPREMRTE